MKSPRGHEIRHGVSGEEEKDAAKRHDCPHPYETCHQEFVGAPQDAADIAEEDPRT